MNRYKIILLILFSVLCIKNSYAERFFISKSVFPRVPEKFCQRLYTDNKELKALEKSADEGNSDAQYQLAIVYNMRSAQRYLQAQEQPIRTGNSIFVFGWQYFAPCDLTKNYLQNEHDK